MTAWLIFMIVCAMIGVMSGGIPGLFGGIGAALVILPFWFVAWVMFFYEPPPPPVYCPGNYASEC